MCNRTASCAAAFIASSMRVPSLKTASISICGFSFTCLSAFRIGPSGGGHRHSAYLRRRWPAIASRRVASCRKHARLSRSAGTTRGIPSPYHFFWNTVPSQPDSIRHAGNRQLRGWQPKEHKMKPVAVDSQPLDTRGKAPARQGGFKCEGDACGGQLPKPGEHHSAGLDRRGFRCVCRQTLRNCIGVGEMGNRECAAQQGRCGSGFPGTVWAGQENHARRVARRTVLAGGHLGADCLTAGRSPSRPGGNVRLSPGSRGRRSAGRPCG